VKKVKILALVSAAVTALLLFVFLNSLNRPAETLKTSVITAVSDIPANTRITASMISTTELPLEAVVVDAISDKSQVIGKISKAEIFSGEQLMNAKLVSAGGSGNKTLAYAINPGMRAISIAVDETSGLAYMITPGNHVDILGEFVSTTTNTADGSNSSGKVSYTTLVLENVIVLAVDNVLSEDGKASSDKPIYTSLTLQVTPRQAMELSEAEFEGQLRAILRSPVDKEETGQSSLTLGDIMVK